MARTRKTSKSTELLAQPDPRAALDVGQFLAIAQRTLDLLTDDLLARADESPAITEALKARHGHEKSKQLTADAYPVWRRGIVVQVAAAWLLSCVFVRTLEDRGLLARNRLAGPGAIDAQRAFFQLAPNLGLREYLLTIFAELDHFPAVERLFDREHNLAWRLAPSPEGAKALVDLFRGPDPEQPHFRFGQASTRFLGDLYQDLSEEVRKRYALLQTPDFVETFILDRTLEPAIAEFGLRETTIIDPTCGSGHFLLGAFERLFAHWSELEPGGSDEAHVERALGSVFGVDVNPYAVFIAQFRLTLAALGKMGVGKIAQAPELTINVVVADSLLHNYDKGQAGFGDLFGQTAASWYGEEFALDDEVEAKRVLQRGYAAVVGNPPYITVKDAALRDRYREIYSAAYREYSLSVPFMQRFFGLAREGGFVGQITSNSFMKREFGKKLIEEYLPTVDLQLIANTSGAFIPGHGTPTVMLFGRRRPPEGPRVAAVLARRGEPTTPEDPAQGLVWSSIRDHWGELGFENEYVTVTEVERDVLVEHPWSLEGGGAAELLAVLEQNARERLSDVCHGPIGRAARIGADDVFMLSGATTARLGISSSWVRPLIVGENVRDWTVQNSEFCIFPYEQEPPNMPRSIRAIGGEATLHYLWRFQTVLEHRATFQGTMKEAGRKWSEYMQYTTSANRPPSSITFAFVATHNHFVLDRGGKVFKQTAPIIKLPESATEEDHLALLAYLNSSTACFLLKQVAQVKQMTGHDSVRITELAQVPREFSGTNVANIAIPTGLEKFREQLIQSARDLSNLGERYVAKSATSAAPFAAGSIEEIERTLTISNREHDLLRRKLIAKQEDLDWLVYRAVGFVDDELHEDDELDTGARAFEIGLRIATGREATIEGDPIPNPQQSLAARPVLKQKLEAIKSSSALQVLEQADFKRRWIGSQGKFNRLAMTYEQEFIDALAAHVFSAIERGWTEPLIRDITRIRALLPNDKLPLLAFAGARTNIDLAVEIHAQSVPFLAALRFSDAGLEKHAVWQQTWEKQRREDAGEKVGEISVPPKYDNKDYRSASFWPLRGKLDVPQERFIAYPGCESGIDNEPIYGWAGWNHAQRAEALLALYTARKTDEAWSTARLTPILAGIHELIPWIKQWHNDPDQDTGERLGDAYDDWLGEELRAHGLTRADLEAWRPVKKGAGKKAAAKQAASDDEPKVAKKKAGRRKKSPARGETA